MKSKDTIASRVGRIISGSAKKVVEILESATPEIVMEEAINEIDGAILEVREELGRTEAEKHRSTKLLSDYTTKLEELANQINLALDKDREDLAEAAVQRQLDIESQQPVLNKSIEEADNKIVELNNYVSALQAKKREMRDELREWRTSKVIAEKVSVGGSGQADADIEAKVARAESAFDRMMSKGPGGLPFDAQNAGKLAELEDLSRENRVKERLTQIKALRGGGDND